MSEVIDMKLKISVNSAEPNVWVPDVPEEVYHADRTAVSSSSLRLISNESEKAFYSRFVEGHEVETTDAMRLGKIIHLAILEGDAFTERYVVMPKFEGLTADGKMSSQSKAAKEKKAEWFSELKPGSLVVTEEERSMLFGIIDSVMAHQDAMAFIRGCEREVSGYYTDPRTGIRLRIRPDFKSSSEGILGEVKSTRSAKKNDFMWQMIRQGWDFQLAMYASGMEAIDLKAPMVCHFIAIEKVRPYTVALYVLDMGSLDWAQTKYHAALARLKGCIDSGQWRPYQERWEHLSVPASVMETELSIEDQEVELEQSNA